MMMAASRFEGGTSFASHGQVFITMWAISSPQRTKMKEVIHLNFYGLRAARRQSLYSGRGWRLPDRSKTLPLPPSASHDVTSPPLVLLHRFALKLTIFFNGRPTNMKERSNQTYSSQIAERPSLHETVECGATVQLAGG